MAYEHERDAWREAVRDLTEATRHLNLNGARWAAGVVGDRDDDQYGNHDGGEDGD